MAALIALLAPIRGARGETMRKDNKRTQKTAESNGHKTVSILKQAVSPVTRIPGKLGLLQGILFTVILAGTTLLADGGAMAAGRDTGGSDPFAITIAPWVSNMALGAVVVAALSCAVYYLHNLLTTAEDM